VAIAVSASSPIQNINELVEMMKADPGAVSWAGGSAGGVDHITVGLLAKAAGIDPTKMNYVAFSGGGEALAAILGNQVTAGISGVGEFLPQVEAGTMRILAVSTAEKWAGTDAPTLMESGYDVNVQNWRMVAAAPGLSEEQKAAVTADIDRMVNSAGWKAALEAKGWANTYLSGADFDTQLATEIETTTAVLKDIGLVK
jgi:putative tricarboxylic transport membrane protein